MDDVRSSKFVVGAEVRIARPVFFLRCGYPLSVKDETQRVIEEKTTAIADFMRSVGVSDSIGDMEKSIRRIAGEIAFHLCKQSKFGGSERTIHTKELPEESGKICSIHSIRFVKTGIREPGHQYGGYDGWEYEPPYLSNAKTHRIIETSLWNYELGTYLEIEAVNVAMVKPEYATEVTP